MSKFDSMKILLADDHSLFRQSLSHVIRSFRLAPEVLEASNGVEVLELMSKSKVDLLVLDIQMPELNGMDTLKELRKLQYKCPVVILTQFDDESLITYLIQLGANSFLSKNCDVEELEYAIDRIFQVGYYYSPRVLTLIQSNLPVLSNDAKLSISPRERQVLNQLKLGRTNKEIAHALELSVRTVETYRRHLLERTKCRNTLELLALAFHTGLIL